MKTWLTARWAILESYYDANKTITHWIVLLALFAIYMPGVLGYSWAKLIWYDELSTLFITRLKTLGDIWAFLQIAADHNPPVLHFMVWAVRQLIPNELIAIRLPSMLGFFLMCVCLYRFISKRLGPAAGLVAALFPIVTLGQSYAYEARPYALMMGFCAAALVAWQETAAGQETQSGRWRRLALIGLALSVSLAVLTHYYATPLLLVLGGSELLRSWETKRFDGWVWLSLGLGAASLVVCWPLLQNTRQFAGLVVSEPIALSTTTYYYLAMFDNLRLALFVGPLAIFIVLSAARPALNHSEQTITFPVPRAEMVAALLMALYPFYIFGLALLVTKAFNYRYALPATVGLALISAYGVAALEKKSPHLTRIAALVLVGLLGLGSAQAALALTRPPANGLNSYPLLTQVPGTDPIVMPDYEAYLQIYYYSPEPLRSRIIYLTNTQAQPNIDDLVLEKLQQIQPLAVEPLPNFMHSHQQFWVYQRDIRGQALPYILDAGDRVILFKQVNNEVLYWVERP